MKEQNRDSRSFEEEIKNDIHGTAQMLSRERSSATSLQEMHAIEIFKRALTVVDCGGVSVSDGSNLVSASDNQLPVPSYLAHGSRVLIQIPPVEKGQNRHEFMNWLVQGDRGHVFTEGSGKESPLFQRTVSSHSTHLKSLENELCAIEDKGVVVGALDAVSALTKPKEEANHFGLNFAFGVNESGLDASGKRVASADGEHGHMYLHYRAPSENNPGTLMIGVENSQPGKSNHSLLGTPNKSTHLGGSKWSDLSKKIEVLQKNLL